jgi:hypothetical protein
MKALQKSAQLLSFFNAEIELHLLPAIENHFRFRSRPCYRCLSPFAGK